MPRGSFLRSLVQIAILGLLLFGSAGRLDWPQGWAFLLFFVLCGSALGVWLQRTDPALLAERMRSPFAADQRPRDRAIIIALMLCFAGWLVLMGLDRRFGWSVMPVWLQGIGAVLFVLAFAGWVPVLRANSFATTAIRLQPDRGQRVISTGPYAVVRHPMYSVALVFLPGIALLLGSWWGLAPILVIIPLLAARTLGEEEVLLAGLPGYRDYTTKVRYRLVPGLW